MSGDLDPPYILLVEGWSLGPLAYLRAGLKHGRARVLQPRLPMPPLLGLWWYDANFLAMLIALLGFFWVLRKIIQPRADRMSSGAWIVFVALSLSATILWIRLMAAVVVRSAVRRGVETCQKLLEQHNVVLVVGFSWGGAVLAELLVEALHDHQDLPAMLLIAPATAVVAEMALRTDTVLRLPASLHTPLHVVHADRDRIVCPHPERWEQVAGVEYTMLGDVHIFAERSNKRRLAEIALELLQQHTGSHEAFWGRGESTTPTPRPSLRRSAALLAESMA